MPTNSEAIGVIEKYVGLGMSLENSFVLYNHAVF